jgi:uncharacterized protein
VPQDAPAPPVSHGSALARVVVFLVLAYTLQFFTFLVLQPFGLLIGSVLGVFAGGALATSIAIRMYRFGALSDIGLRWHAGAWRNSWAGFAIGAVAAAGVTGLPVITGLAYFVPSPEYPFSWSGLLLMGILLLFGALGEELIFRGYPFQLLAGRYGIYQILLPSAVLFAAAHSGNLDSSSVSLFNTFLWGVILGYALLRSGDLWLPTGIHFGWNFTLPLFGVNLSGFRMGLTGYKLEWRLSDLWSGGNYGPEAGLLTLIAAVLVFVAVHRLPLVRQRLLLMPDLVESTEEPAE